MTSAIKDSIMGGVINVAEAIRNALRRHWPLLLVLALALGVRLWFGPQIREDAYITLRYVQNLAAGRGMVYNAGERVLGTTTPLFTLLLAALAVLGASPASTAVLIGMLGDLVSVALIYALGRRIGGPGVGTIAGLLYTIAAPVVAYSVSGMETPIYVAMILATFLLWDMGRLSLAGAMMGALLVMRADGAMVGATLIVIEAWRTRSLPWRTMIWAILFALPWLLFATVYFGSPVPQSIVAKLGLGGGDPWLSARDLAWYFTDLDTRWFLPLTAAALIGTLTIVRRSVLASQVLAWAAVYALAFVLANKLLYPTWPFEWYNLPLLPPFFLLASVGLLKIASVIINYSLWAWRGHRVRLSFAQAWETASGPGANGRSPRIGLPCLLPDVAKAIWPTIAQRRASENSRSWLPQGIVALLILAVFLPVLARQRTELIKIVGGREQLYAKLADAMAAYGASTDLVAAPEIGALGYFYPGPILDTHGLVSPAAVGRSFAELLQTNSPSWIVSYDTLIPDDLKKSSWFQREYRPVRVLANWEGRKATLYRRYPLVDEAEGRHISLGSLAWLENYTAQVQKTKQGRLLHLDVIWQAQETAAQRYTMFFHLMDGRGHVVAAQDNEPQEGTLPTTSYVQGQLLRDRADLAVPVDFDLAEASLELGAYETGHPDRRLEWTDRASNSLGVDLRLPLFPPAVAPSPCAVRFGESLRLDRAYLTRGGPGEADKLSLFWRAMAPVGQDFTVFVHLLDEANAILAQADGPPSGGTMPTSIWLPGELVRDDHLTSLTTRNEGQLARIAIGMYDLKTGRRLALTSNPTADAVVLKIPMPPAAPRQDDATPSQELDLCQAAR